LFEDVNIGVINVQIDEHLIDDGGVTILFLIVLPFTRSGPTLSHLPLRKGAVLQVESWVVPSQETVWPLTCGVQFFALPNPVSSLSIQPAEIVFSLCSPVILCHTAVLVSNVGTAAGLVATALHFAIDAEGLGVVGLNVVSP